MTTDELVSANFKHLNYVWASRLLKLQNLQGYNVVIRGYYMHEKGVTSFTILRTLNWSILGPCKTKPGHFL